ncbi:MAG: DEAD/DEAH box helicase, partial [Chloroflexota bacterium]|nr:DEAD/DEAH box helicase [Chloroflexota bacterium]
MTPDVSWWRVPPDSGAGAASWMGDAVLPAAAPAGAAGLRLDLPKRLLVPAPRDATPRRAVVSATAVPGVPRWLEGDWPCPSARILDDPGPGAGADEGGTIDLTGSPWKEVPPPPAAGVLDGSAAPASDGAATPAEVPLWRRLAYLLQPPAELLLAPSGPVEWPGSFFPYQITGIQALIARETLLLADDMGLGKTVQAAAALRILALQGQVESGLLVAPAGLLGQWRRALRLWAPELRLSTIRGAAEERAWQWKAPAHVYLTSYETLREDCTDSLHSPPRRRLWDVVVLDEAQRIKNRDSEVSRKCKLLRRRRAWALSGTPLENSLDDLASVLEFVTPHRDAQYRDAPHHDGPPRDGAGRPAPSRYSLLERLRTLQLRRRKADVLPQLPPKIVSRIVLPLTGAQRESYERAERDGIVALRERGAHVRIDNVLDLIVRLKQFCNFCPASGESAKLDDLRQRLHTLRLQGHRALVFSQFVDGRYGARALANHLTALHPLLYTGELSLPQRDAVVHQFRNDPRRTVLLLSLRAGGSGLNLQEASYVFHFDRWWNPAVERQAEDRSHRLGQSLPVHVYAYTCEDTIEERIDAVLQRKQHLFDQVIDEVTLDLR